MELQGTPIERLDGQRRQIHILKTANIDRHSTVSGRIDTFPKRMDTALRAKAVSDLVFVKRIGAKILFRRKQMKAFPREHPEKRPFLRANGTIAFNHLRQIAFNLESNVSAMTASFVNHHDLVHSLFES